MYLNHLSLCSGIGGLDLAAEWAGFRTVAQCEIDGYASKVLAKNFKGVPNLHDIRTVTNRRLRGLGIDPEEITVVSAGFPCQPYSLAGKGKGDRDGRDLWGEVARVLGEIRPRWFIGENTPGLFSRENQRYFRRVLSDLAALGYSVGWGIWGACDVGAPHKRDRVFIMAYSHGKRRKTKYADKREPYKRLGKSTEQTLIRTGGIYGTARGGVFYSGNLSDADGRRQQECGVQRISSVQPSQVCSNISDARSERKIERRNGCTREIERHEGLRSDHRGRAPKYVGGEWWEAEPDVGRVAHGVSARVDKLRCLGNAVVPYQAFPIFDTIAEFELSLIQ